MKKFLFIILTVMFLFSCDVPDSGDVLVGDGTDKEDTEDTGDTGNSGDTGDTGDTGEEEVVAECGNNIVEDDEVCDGGVKSCSELGLGEGEAPCLYDCSGWDTYDCEFQAECGNGTVEGDEECDDNTEKCEKLGNFSDGIATCNDDCSWNLSDCESAVETLEDPTCGTHLGNQERNELKSFVEERVLGDNPEPEYFRLSWRSEPAISMVVTWTTKDSSSSEMTRSTVLRVSKNSDMSDYIEISSENNGTMVGSARTLPYSNAWKTVHVAEICGLEPDTKYYYQGGGIGADETEVFGDIYHFRTAPDPRLPYEDQNFTFVAMGDSRGAATRLGRTLKGAMSRDPLFITFGGDFVDDGTNQNQWDEMFDATKETMPYVPILPVAGNHEKSAVNYYAQFSLPGNERWYGMAVGNAVFAQLEDCWTGAGLAGAYGIACNGTMTHDSSAEQLQVDFMNNLFGTHADKPWKFASHHRPTHSETTSLTHGGRVNQDIASSWGAVFDTHNVTMVFNGHDHFYQRHMPLLDGNVVDNVQGTHYIVTAGAGATLYDVKDTGTVASTKAAVHYVAVTINGYDINMESIELHRDSGDVVGTLDTLSFSK
ncbi:MAG: metallophosphoesterase [bacterium]